jgi:hypothetical protein
MFGRSIAAVVHVKQAGFGDFAAGARASSMGRAASATTV